MSFTAMEQRACSPLDMFEKMQHFSHLKKAASLRAKRSNPGHGG
jgi:hypothetical protein